MKHIALFLMVMTTSFLSFTAADIKEVEYQKEAFSKNSDIHGGFTKLEFLNGKHVKKTTALKLRDREEYLVLKAKNKGDFNEVKWRSKAVDSHQKSNKIYTQLKLEYKEYKKQKKITDQIKGAD